jgi:hypothetical protein
MPIIPALGRLRKGGQFQTNLGCTERPYIKNKQDNRQWIEYGPWAMVYYSAMKTKKLQLHSVTGSNLTHIMFTEEALPS